MKVNEFHRLPEIIEENFISERLDVGDKFLHGESMIEQKDSKEIGDNITYFEIISKSKEGKRVAYSERIEKLEM